jgi:hypothetical protein
MIYEEADFIVEKLKKTDRQRFEEEMMNAVLSVVEEIDNEIL